MFFLQPHMVANPLSTANVATIAYVDKDKIEFLLLKDINNFCYIREAFGIFIFANIFIFTLIMYYYKY